MTISSSLNAGIMGLSANASRLGTIADNIANSDTFGYKRSVTDFQSMVIRGNTGVYSAGGVRVDTQRDVDTQGSLISTTNSTDIAVAGRGLLPVTNESGINPQETARDLMLTATGAFSADEDGYLRTNSGLYLLGWPSDPQGDIGSVTRQGGASLEPVKVDVTQFESTPTRNINMGINLPADATRNGANGEPYEISMEYFDNFGRVQLVNAVFTPTVPATGSSNSWGVELFDNATGTPVSIANFGVAFQDDSVNGGSISAVTNNNTYNAETGEITISTQSGDIQLFVGRPNDRSGLTQFATSFAPYNLVSDGAAIGNLLDIEIDGEGNLQAIYDTGYRETLYRIPVGDVPNPNALVANNNQAFQISQESGDVYFWDAGTGPVGETVGFSLMESTTDVATELTALIETQRAYSSNAKIIQTVDELLQEANNLVR